MTWTIDSATAPISPFSSQTNPITHTCASTAKLLICYLFVNGITARTGGAPTYNGDPMTDSGQGFVFYASTGECGVEIWYLINPDTGSAYNLSVPNTGSVSMGISAVSYIPSAGGCVYDNSNKATGTTQNPSLSLTVSATGNLVLGGLGSGDRDVPTAGTNFTLHHTSDEGNQTWGSEYDLAGSATPVTVAFGTARADDWGLIGISFEETAATPTISVSDALTVADSPTITPLVLEGISQSEGVTLGDTPTMALQDPTPLAISQSEDLTVADSPTLDPLLLEGIDQAEDLTLGESVTVDPLLLEGISQSEGITLGDSASATVTGAGVEDLEVQASESLTVEDTIPTFVDNVTIGESVTVEIVFNITVEDGLTVGDTPTLDPIQIEAAASDGLTVGEAASADVTIEAIASDNLDIADTPTFDPIQIEASATESITLGESAAAAITEAGAFTISVSEDLTVADSPTLDPLLLEGIDQSESITVGDSPTIVVEVEGELYISQAESVTVADTPTVDPLLINASASDGLTVADSPTVTLGALADLEVSVSDGITVADTATMGPVQIEATATDGLTVADSGAIDPLVINATATDGLTIADSPSVTAEFFVSVSDGVTVSDVPTLGALLIALTATDGLTVADSITAEIPGYILLGDPDNFIFIEYRDARVYIKYVDDRVYVQYRDKRIVT